MNNQVSFVDWIFFFVSAIRFIAASQDDFWAKFGELVFLIACMFFYPVLSERLKGAITSRRTFVVDARV